MITLAWLFVAIGLAPLVAGALRLAPSSDQLSWKLGSVLLCALAFNLTFFWQELWLVIPKALTPGLHPVLYHNDHSWTGDAPIAELLQGTGALATFTSGMAFLGATRLAGRLSMTWRLFLFWMAFQGLFQALTQLAIGAVLPGNDVGRALAYLQVGATGRWSLLILDAGAMAVAGGMLARLSPTATGKAAGRPTRTWILEMTITVLTAVVLIAPFRLPRDLVEVVVVPLFVNLVGVGWLAFGAAYAAAGRAQAHDSSVAVAGPAIALAATLLIFQVILRPGIAF